MLPLSLLRSRCVRCAHGTCDASKLFSHTQGGSALSLASRWKILAVCDNHAREHVVRAQSSSSSEAGADGPIGKSTINVAFVGLGNMGLRMALNLARPRKGDELPPMNLTVYDLNESNISTFFTHFEDMDGVANSISSLSASSDLVSLGESNPDFVITSLPTCGASEAVVGDIVKSLPSNQSNASASAGKGGCTFVDTSTISPSISKKLHQLVTSVSPHHDYVDAPVSGGVKGAGDGTLTFMVGCSSNETSSSIKPLLYRMGKRMIPCGGPGSGSAAKLCNNTALAAQMVSTSN